jgi:hypothetical protein
MYTYEIVKLNSGNTSVDTRDDLLGDGNGVDVVRIEAVTQP